MGLIAIGTPVFDDQESFAELCRHVRALEASRGDLKFHVVAVDDCSLGAPPKLEALSAIGLSGEVLRLARNVGHQTAIAIGLARVNQMAGVAACVVMDSDGEDRPEAIPEMLAALAKGDVDACAAERARRYESFTFRTFYSIYRALFKILTGQRLRFGNFIALSPQAVARLSGMYETATHVAGAVVKARLRRAELPIDRGPRYAGSSKMSFPGLVLHGMRAVMVFADLVLTRMALALGALAALVVVVLVGALTAKFMGYATPGWVTIVTGFALSLFLQTALFTMITLIVSSLGRVDTPPRVRERALEFVASIERADAQAQVAAQ